MHDYDDSFGEPPALIGGDRLELADLGGPGAELSTGLILTWRERLLFALAPNAVPLGAQDRSGVMAFVGIGGHLDAGENWSDAVVREALEEAHCSIALGDSAVTYLCREGQPPRPLAYRWREAYRPLLVWTATFMLRRGPAQQRIPVPMVNAVFRAVALCQPTPGMEVPALLALDPETLLHTCAEPRTLRELRERGALIVGEGPADECLIAPGGSAYFYGQWLAWQSSG